MLSLLRRHAVNELWSSPKQDFQHILKVARIGSTVGVFNQSQVYGETVTLPTHGERYHVFTLGGRNSAALGVVLPTNRWYSFAELINHSTLYADIYFEHGQLYPRSITYLKKLNNGTLALCCLHTDDIQHIALDVPVYIRFYTNAFYNTLRSQVLDGQSTTCVSARATNAQTVLTMQQRFRAQRNVPGKTTAYVNGYYVDDFIPSLIPFNAYIEYVFDPSVFRSVEFKLVDLPVFDSHLDGKNKFLLHPPKTDRNTIEFLDDLEVYVYQVNSNNRRKGIVLHRHQANWLRMVTHQDYSLATDVITRIHSDLTQMGVWTKPLLETHIRLSQRESGFKRPLITERHRIKTLYELHDEQIVKAMLGQGVMIEEWFAPNLEASKYLELSGRLKPHFTDEELIDVYGYNGIATLFANTPFRVEPTPLADRAVIPIQPTQIKTCTIYEYDNDGKYLGMSTHQNELSVIAQFPQTRKVEVLANRGTNEPDIVYGQGTVYIDPIHSYRVYLSSRVGNQVMNDWVDITDTDRVVYYNDNQTIVVQYNQVTEFIAVKSDKTFLSRNYNLLALNGVYEFSVNNLANVPDIGNHVLHIPPRKVDVILNGHMLIEDLDFFIKWPRIVITNKKYLIGNDQTPQQVHVRATGFCNPDMSLDKPRDQGFVKHGYLSANNRYDLRDGKVLYAIVDGCLRLVSELDFEEQSDGIIVTNTPNGVPYAIREHVVPLQGNPLFDTYVLRDRENILENKIQDYLTVKLPPPVIGQPNSIFEKYPLYSPTINRLISDMKTNVFDNEKLYGRYSDAQAMDWFEPYRYLFDYDPAMKDMEFGYVDVYPHKHLYEVELTIYQLNYIRRIINLLMSDRVNTSRFIKVLLPGEQP